MEENIDKIDVVIKGGTENDGSIQSEDRGNNNPIQPKPHNGKKKDDSGPSTQSHTHDGHNEKKIIVSQDMSYVVTYSGEDNSICGWVEKDRSQLEQNGELERDVCKMLDIHNITEFVLYKKFLLLLYFDFQNFGTGK